MTGALKRVRGAAVVGMAAAAVAGLWAATLRGQEKPATRPDAPGGGGGRDAFVDGRSAGGGDAVAGGNARRMPKTPADLKLIQALVEAVVKGGVAGDGVDSVLENAVVGCDRGGGVGSDCIKRWVCFDGGACFGEAGEGCGSCWRTGGGCTARRWGRITGLIRGW